LIKAVAGRRKTVKAFIAMTDHAHMPKDAGIDNLLCYEDLIQQCSSDYSWPVLDEDAASTLCYTSGTTGNPISQAACIAAKHAKWDERPLLIVVRKPQAELKREELLAFYEGKIAKWWTPDDVVFVDEIPLGATGKILKNQLRERFGDFLMQPAECQRVA
jgi:acyl-CoA synthetase (AMP-forming)/AMP-acid ligase II